MFQGNSRGGLCAAVRAGEARGGRRGLGRRRAQGSFLPTGEEKQIHFSAFERKEGQLFLMLRMYRDKRIVPRSVLFILCLQD